MINSRRVFTRVVIATTMLLTAAVLPTPASADIVIDFEGLAASTIITNQYLGLGASFTAPEATILTLGGSLNPAFPPFSGINVIFDTTGQGGSIRIDAAGPEWTMAGGYVTGNLVVMITAYDSMGNSLGSSSTQGPNYIGAGTGFAPNEFISVSAPNIAYIEFMDGGNTYTVDDFTFQPIPAPGALLLGAMGLGLVGWLKRRVA